MHRAEARRDDEEIYRLSSRYNSNCLAYEIQNMDQLRDVVRHYINDWGGATSTLIQLPRPSDGIAAFASILCRVAPHYIFSAQNKPPRHLQTAVAIASAQYIYLPQKDIAYHIKGRTPSLILLGATAQTDSQTSPTEPDALTHIGFIVPEICPQELQQSHCKVCIPEHPNGSMAAGNPQSAVPPPLQSGSKLSKPAPMSKNGCAAPATTLLRAPVDIRPLLEVTLQSFRPAPLTRLQRPRRPRHRLRPRPLAESCTRQSLCPMLR
ncbi:MAG: hypothetical protein JO316_19395 [Abitibacteriaceae bacterium]|nr:hypothetical protein [Abditibacteriaceae bacterium]MBV9867523.1 hypothetical protein [Abditibacteriaceae bacterium]